MSEIITSDKYIVIKVVPIRSLPWHLLVHERESRDSLKNNLTLVYRRLSGPTISPYPKPSPFYASYEIRDDKFQASLFSHGIVENGALFLDPDDLRGNHIGTYLMDRIVEWLQENCPKAEVIPVKLEIGQATNDKKDRRNKFWENFGLIFEWQNSVTRKVGVSKRMKVDQLIRCKKNWERNIEEIQILDYFDNLNQKIRDLSDDLNMMTSQNEKLENELRFARLTPVRFFIKTIMQRNIR